MHDAINVRMLKQSRIVAAPMNRNDCSQGPVAWIFVTTREAHWVLRCKKRRRFDERFDEIRPGHATKSTFER
jgi:sporulation protein YlmC with PRC-barrel domain